MQEYIGINIFTQNFDTVKEIVENCPVTTTIIIGGQVVKCVYSVIFIWNVKNNLILIIGEGELILPSIINGVCSQQPIIALDGKVVYRVDENSIYFPRDLEIVQLDRALLKDE